MLFKYKIITTENQVKHGEIEAGNQELAISALQRRGFIVVEVIAQKGSNIDMVMKRFFTIPLKELVMMSRQLSTLFEAQVSAVKAFGLLATNITNTELKQILETISSDIQAGISISKAMEKHPRAFSDFYVNMVEAGEESGRLKDTFTYLAEYMEREYALTSKTKNALVYPAFVIGVFFIVMILMMTVVIPKLGKIIIESGQDVPTYTKIVIAISTFLVNYGLYFLVVLICVILYFAFLLKGGAGKERIDRLKLQIPYLGDVYRKLYLSRIADNIHTMLLSGIPVLRTLEITANIVDNKVYEFMLRNSIEEVKAGTMMSDALSKYKEMPQILTAMMKVGEETGQLAQILDMLAKFYKREVDSAIDSMIGLIEPAMIIGLGLSVGTLLASVLMPIYNIAGGIN